MNIVVAETAGFCFGVERAVDIAMKIADGEKNGRVFTYGELIHNPQVNATLAEKDVTVCTDVSLLQKGDTVIIRSHGVPPQIVEQMENTGVNIVDATCPYVKKIHNIVAKASQQGQAVIIIGSHDHPEVLGIRGWAGDRCFVCGNIKELEECLKDNHYFEENGVIMVSQTTTNINFWQECRNYLKKVCTNGKIFDTICSTTHRRQTEATALASKCDAMIVIGGRNSSNTTKLYELCKERCADTYFAETTCELREISEILKQKKKQGMTVGITAGASTPAFIIREAIKNMSDNNTNLGAELDFATALEDNLKTLTSGNRVKGVIAAIAPNELRVDLGTKYAGFVPLSEVSADPTVKIDEAFKVGDEIELFVVRVNDDEGTIMLSRKKIDLINGWDNIMAASESHEVLTGTVRQVVKGGIVILYNGFDVFVPATLVSSNKSADLEAYVGKTVSFKIIEAGINRSRRRVLGSIRAVEREERKAAREKFWSEIEVGKKYTGPVKSLTQYGAFVDLGGVDGMIHITEMSWGRLKNPAEIFNVGDEVEVYVKAYDPEKKRISLGYKDPNADPWELIKQYNVGDVVAVKIVKLMEYGAFAEVIPNIDGLIHISQIADRRINKPSDVLTEGETVNAKIIELDTEKKRISLSIRATLEPQAEEAVEEATEEAAE
ncbi:MAG: bifunctional 4-hydroxy-3-methylbut-2-enyl diphosphate reductase/30S ribosomal protein S1 [Ruminococcaceae bacterium]|nr:bifunctional 4-hydroxy-3-methylbut-2-enyl diphosphate reductase/30S ribosomal protein S1 [Oscillospiraceae bacterium]